MMRLPMIADLISLLLRMRMEKKFSLILPAVTSLMLFSCTPSDRTLALHSSEENNGQIELFDGRVIPALPQLLGMRAQYELRLDWLEQLDEGFGMFVGAFTTPAINWVAGGVQPI